MVECSSGPMDGDADSYLQVEHVGFNGGSLVA